MNLRDACVVHAASELPAVLWLELTSRCPLDCIFCTRRSLRGDGQHMDFHLYRSLLSCLRRPSILRLNYAGESGHYPHLEEALRLAGRTGAVTELVTALVSLPDAQVDMLADSPLTRLTVSLHTLDPEQFPDIYRFGSRQEMDRKIRRFLVARRRHGRAQPRLDFAFVALERNLRELASVAAYARSLGVTDLFVHPVIGRDPLPVTFAAELSAGRLTDSFAAALRKTVSEVTACYPEVRISLSTPELEPLPELDARPRPYPGPLPQGARIHGCDQNPFETVHVLANGDVVVCEVRDRIVVGNLHHAPLRAIWNGEGYRRFRREYAAGEVADCRRCPYKSAYLPTPAASAIDLRRGSSWQLLRGWYPPEDGIVWSGAAAQACLQRPAGRASLEVEGLLPRVPHGNDNRLEIVCQGVRLGAVDHRGDGLYGFRKRFRLPGTEAGVLFVEFRVDRPYRPFQDEGQPDLRELGFALQRMQVL